MKRWKLSKQWVWQWTTESNLFSYQIFQGYIVDNQAMWLLDFVSNVMRKHKKKIKLGQIEQSHKGNPARIRQGNKPPSSGTTSGETNGFRTRFFFSVNLLRSFYEFSDFVIFELIFIGHFAKIRFRMASRLFFSRKFKAIWSEFCYEVSSFSSRKKINLASALQDRATSLDKVTAFSK